MLNSEEPSYTWSNARGNVQSRLDRMYISDCVPWSVVSLKTVKVSFSDHKILKMGLKLKPNIERGKLSLSITRNELTEISENIFNLRKLNNLFVFETFVEEKEAFDNLR